MHDMQKQTGAPLTAQPTGAAALPARGAYRGLVWAIALIVLIVDQGTKVWALKSLEPGVPRALIGDLIRLRLIRNAGAAFSVLDGMTYVVTVVAVAIVVWIFVVAHRRLASRAYALCLGAVAGGALGNLADRFVREPGPGRGHVVDFIDYFGWFVGNVADIVIVLTAIAVLALIQRGYHLDGTRTGD